MINQQKGFRLLSVVIFAMIIGPVSIVFGVPRGPISITSDSGFTSANGVSDGAGTEASPYIIENWDITLTSSDSQPGIRIRNTTKYFIVRNCTVVDGAVPNEMGIHLDNVSNGTVDGCTLDNNRRAHIRVEDCDYVTISDNVCTDGENNPIGVYCTGTDNSVISGNSVSGTHTGMYFSSSTYNYIFNNTSNWNNSIGMQFRYGACHHNRAEGNDCSYNGRIGISIADGAHHNTMLHNNCDHNDQSDVSSCGGIWLSTAGDYNIIWGNDIDDNNKGGGSGGITTAGEHGPMYRTLIAFNTLVDNEHGIYAEGSGGLHDGWIHHNNLIDNSSQGNRPNSQNRWHNGYPSGGNYWNDYNGSDTKSGPNQDQPGSDNIGDSPYRTHDRYPLMALADDVNGVADTFVENAEALNISDSSATIGGVLTFEGYEWPGVKVYWGTSDGGTNPASWENVQELNEATPGSFSIIIVGLNPETTYYYRCFSTDYTGDDWASTTESFTTALQPEVTPPLEEATFDSLEAAESQGWTGGNLPDAGNDFGFSNTANAGGPAGEMGGIVSRTNKVSCYGDETIGGGLLTANQILSAEGTMMFNDLNYDGSFGFGWYQKAAAGGSSTPTRLGMKFSEESDGLRIYADALGATSSAITKNNGVFSWSLSYDPEGGAGVDGRLTLVFGGTTRTVDVPVAKKSTGFDAFGLFTHTMSNRDDNIEVYFDNLSYSSFGDELSPDINSDGVITFSDHRTMSARWQQADCDGFLNQWCGRTDLNMNGQVDWPDLLLLSQLWLEVFGPPVLTVTGGNFEPAILTEGGIAFSNRDYTWVSVPSQFEGRQYTRTAGGETASINVSTNADDTVYIATAIVQSNTPDLSDWTATGLKFSYTDTNQTEMHIFSKPILAGQNINIPQGNWSGSIVICDENAQIMVTNP